MAVLAEAPSNARTSFFCERKGACSKIKGSMSDRTFTLDEAHSSLPVLQLLLLTAICRQREREKKSRGTAGNESPHLSQWRDVSRCGHACRRKAERIKAEQRAKDAIAEIDSIGVQVKDIDIGLLDFPCVVDGRVILLCWKTRDKLINPMGRNGGRIRWPQANRRADHPGRERAMELRVCSFLSLVARAASHLRATLTTFLSGSSNLAAVAASR